MRLNRADFIKAIKNKTVDTIYVRVVAQYAAQVPVVEVIVDKVALITAIDFEPHIVAVTFSSSDYGKVIKVESFDTVTTTNEYDDYYK